MKILAWSLLLFLLPGMEAAEELEVTYEVFSLPMSEAAKLRRAKLGGEKAYERILDWLKKKKIRQEQFTVVKLLGEVSSMAEEVQEYIFPTEYEGRWYCLGQGSGIGVFAPPPPLPTWPEVTAFDTKNLGQTLDIEVRRAGAFCHVRMRPTKIGLTAIDAFGHGISQVEMARFSIQTLSTEFEAALNKPVLVGTISPPRHLQEAGEKRVWLAFLTCRQSG